MMRQALVTESPEVQSQPRHSHARRREKIRIIPLGGVGEVGMNMMVYEYGADIFAVDCGHMFPDEDLLGVDLVIPDTTYLEERRDRVRAVIVTHAHDDHMGALPYFLKKLPVPVIGPPLACEILRERLAEHGLDQTTQFIPVSPGETILLGDVEVEFLHVTHSVPQSLALAIHLPFGSIVHSSDYKIDTAPIYGPPFDFQGFARCGERGVVALLCDSTNVEREGRTPPERSLMEPLDRIFAMAPRSIIFSCFASALHRIQIVLDLALRHRKKVFVTGLNMARNIAIAERLGILSIPTDHLLDLSELRRVAPERRVILTTGSQGEPLSALSRMAIDEHKEIKIKPGDTVILSSRIIPGNERMIYAMINHLFRRGAEVFYEGVANVHVSGHAYREDMRTLIALCKPRYLIPIHGEFRHLVLHKHLAEEAGMDPDKIFLLQNGEVLEIDADGAARAEKLNVSRVLVDGDEVGSIDDIVLRDRRRLSEDGMVIAVLVVDRATGQLVAGPDIVSRGFLFMDENEPFFDQCKTVVKRAFDDCAQEGKQEWSVVKEAVRAKLKRYIKSETGRFPYILPVVLEI
ncbi:MAG: ribonuclease J [Candidatus Sumerlaea chitinivorans]|nr:ribonuclease J [Candidatus Sumerlaea chitinivorans]